MLDINPDIVCSIIQLAREFHSKEEVVIPDEPDMPDDDWPLQVLADHSEDLSYQELKSTIEDLEPDQQISLVALLWVGRGDYDADDWDNVLREATANATNHVAEYLIATPLVASYLEEGLAQLGYDCEG
jgi:hypothetical protein